MTMVFSIHEGKLRVRDDGARTTLWEGLLDGVAARKLLPLPGQNRCIVLLDPAGSSKPTFENLLCIDGRGRTIWRAKLPRSHDAFVDVMRRGDAIEALTWNGLRVQVDEETGETSEISFTK